MDVLDRYVLKEFCFSFFGVSFGLTALILGMNFFESVWSMPYSGSHILLIFACRAPALFQKFLPMSALLSTLITVGTMSSQNEVLALYAGGISKTRFLSSFVALVATLSSLCFLILDPLMPLIRRQELQLQNQATGALPMAGGFWFRDGQRIYSVGRYDSQAQRFETVTEYHLSPDFLIVGRIHGTSVQKQDGRWIYHSGTHLLAPRVNPFPILESFEKYAGTLPERATEIKTARIEEEIIRLRDLRKHIVHNRNLGVDVTPLEVVYFERMAMIFSPVMLVLLAFPFAIKTTRGHILGRSIALAFLMIILFLLTQRTFVSLGRAGNIQPWLAGWGASCLFLLFAIFNYRKEKVT